MCDRCKKENHDCYEESWEPDDRRSELNALLSAVPTEKQVFDACMFFRHDFGLLDKEDRDLLAWRAKEWLVCWQKAFGA